MSPKSRSPQDRLRDLVKQGNGSLGFFTNPAALSLSITVGDPEGNIVSRQTDLKSGVPLALPGFPQARLAFDNYEHSWWCQWFPRNHCESTLKWSAYCVDERDGSVINWDSVQVAAREDTHRIGADEVERQNYVQHFSRVGHFSVNWHKDGHDPDFNSAAKCWISGAWWLFQIWSHA